MKMLLTIALTTISIASAVADQNGKLSCKVTISQTNGGILDISRRTKFPDFFAFEIDPAVARDDAWVFQNTCLSKKDTSGARYKGDVCIELHASSPREAPRTLDVEIGHYAERPALSRGPFSTSSTRAASLVVPFPPSEFSMQLSSQNGGVSLVQLRCGDE